MVLEGYSAICTFNFTYNSIKKIILILLSILFASNAHANHYSKRIDNNILRLIYFKRSCNLFSFSKALTSS